MYRPTTSAGPNRLALAPSPSTQTGAARLFSSAVKNRPSIRRSAAIAVFRVDAVDHRHVLLRFGDHLRGREALARRGLDDARDVYADHPVVLEGQARRELADLLVRLLIRV